MHRGDHIQIYRGGYYHHGIDIGDGTVIHFSGEPLQQKRSAIIRRSLLMEFLDNDGEHEVVNYPANQRLPPDATIGHAFSFLGKGGYNLVFRNCEHFATYCKTGQWASAQVGGTVERMVFKWSKFGLINPWLFVTAPFVIEAIRAAGLKAIHEITKPSSSRYNGLTYLASMYVDAYSNVFLLDSVGNWFQSGPDGQWYPNHAPQFAVNLVGHVVNRNGQAILATNFGAFVPGINGQWYRLE